MNNNYLRTVAIVVPCYNEEKRLNLFAFRRFLVDEPRCRLVLVNDGSRDGTLELLQQFQNMHQPGVVDVVDLPVNGGKAEAVRQGMIRAIESGAELVGFWDADLATPLDAVKDFLQVFDHREDIEIVVGSRVPLLGHTIERNPKRGLLGRCFAWSASWILGIRLADTQCGAKMFRASSVLKAVLLLPFQSRWIFDVELLSRWCQLQRVGAPDLRTCLYERPLEAWYEIQGSRLKVTDFIKAPFELIRIWIKRLQPVPSSQLDVVSFTVVPHKDTTRKTA